MQSKRASDEKEKTMVITVLQRSRGFSKFVPRKGSSLRSSTACRTSSGVRGEALAGCLLKDLLIPRRLSRTRGSEAGELNPARAWKWLTAATIRRTDAYECVADA